MTSAKGVVVFNRLAKIAADFPQEVADRINEQVLKTEDDVIGNIQRYDLIDTGNMLGSVAGRMTGEFSGEVTVSAESEDGYPYPAAQNYGTAHIPASPFFTDAINTAEQEFPKRFDDLVLG